MIRILLLVFLAASFSSCHNCVCAPSDGLRLALIRFDSTEVDTLIVRKFRKAGNFTQMIDTVQWDRSVVSFRKYHDTFQMSSSLGSNKLNSQFDYQVFVPAANRLFTVTELNEPQLTGDCSGKVMCVNQIVSGKLNSTAIPIQNDILYLKK